MDKNKNLGFTLVEMIGVVVLLSIISIIVTPIVENVLDDNKEQAYNDQINSIIDSAKIWGAENLAMLPDSNGDVSTITLGVLQGEGYAKKNLKNPKTGENFDPDYTQVRITSQNGILNYEVIFE